MKPKPTMTPEQEATWTATITGSKLVGKRAIHHAISVSDKLYRRRRAYTVEELWELWAEWQSQSPHNRDGAEFLLWLEKK